MTDTPQKRSAAINVGPGVMLPAPDGVIDAGDRAQLAGAYRMGADEPAAAYPSVPASRSIRLPAGGIWSVDPDIAQFCEVDFSALIPSGTTLTSVSRSIPSGLEEQDFAVDTQTGRFAIKLSGATHASMHQVGIVGTLSNGQAISITAPLRCFNG
jgi:hypothetical protein